MNEACTRTFAHHHHADGAVCVGAELTDHCVVHAEAVRCPNESAVGPTT